MPITPLPFPHGTTAGDIAEGANKSTTNISGTVDGRFLAPNENLTSAALNRAPWALSTNIDHLNSNKADIKALDRSQPNACVGQPPTLNFNAGPLTIDYTSFWCLINGEVHEIASGSEAVSAAYAILYVDNTGTVQLSESAVAYPAIDPEDNLILGYGENGAGAWSAEYAAAMSLNSKPSFLTVGVSDVYETNFATINDAISFINYMNTSVSDTVALAANEFYSPTIYVTAPTIMSESVTLEGPIKIVGGPAGLSSYSATTRTPNVFFTVSSTLFDCGSNALVVENLSFIYDTSEGVRSDYIFKETGAYSSFYRVFVSQDEPGSPTELDGCISGAGYTTIDRCLFYSLSSTVAGNAGIALDNAFNCSIIDSYFHTDGCGGAGSLLHVDDPINFRVIGTKLESDNTPSEVVHLTNGSGNARDVTFTQCILDSGDSGDTVLDGDGSGFEIHLDKCDIVGTLNIGTSTAINTFTMSDCLGADIYPVVHSANININGCQFENYVELHPDGHGAIDVLSSTFNVASDDFCLALYGEGSDSNRTFTYTIKDCVFNMFGNTNVTEKGVGLFENSTTNVSTLTITGCAVKIDTSISATAFRGFEVNTCKARKVNIHHNDIFIRTTNTGSNGLNNTKGIEVLDVSTSFRAVNIHRNNITIDGDTRGTSVSLSSSVSGVVGAYVHHDGTDGGVDVSYNAINFVTNTANYQTYTGIMLNEVEHGQVNKNIIHGAMRGIVATQYNVSSDYDMEYIHVCGNQIHRWAQFTTADDVDASSAVRSPVGVLIGHTDSGNDANYISVVCHKNIIDTNAQISADVDKARRAISVKTKDDGPGDGNVSFHGNIVRDETGYEGGFATPIFYAWHVTYNAAADFVPISGGAETSLEHNIANSSSYTTVPAT